MGKDYKVVYWAENKVEADIIMGMLKEFSIPSRALQESFGSANGLSFGIFGQIAIAVEEDRIAEAEALFIDMDDDLTLDD